MGTSKSPGSAGSRTDIHKDALTLEQVEVGKQYIVHYPINGKEVKPRGCTLLAIDHEKRKAKIKYTDNGNEHWWSFEDMGLTPYHGKVWGPNFVTAS